MTSIKAKIALFIALLAYCFILIPFVKWFGDAPFWEFVQYNKDWLGMNICGWLIFNHIFTYKYNGLKICLILDVLLIVNIILIILAHDIAYARMGQFGFHLYGIHI